MALLRPGHPSLLHQQLHQLFHVFRERTEIPRRFPQHFLLRPAEEAGHADHFVWNGDDRSSEHVHDDDDPDDPAIMQQISASPLANAQIYKVVQESKPNFQSIVQSLDCDEEDI